MSPLYVSSVSILMVYVHKSGKRTFGEMSAYGGSGTNDDSALQQMSITFEQLEEVGVRYQPDNTGNTYSRYS